MGNGVSFSFFLLDSGCRAERFFFGGGNRLNLREEKCSLGKTDQSKVRTLTLGTYDVGEIPEAIEAF